MIHSGGCHCGRVRFEVDAPARIDAIECNCSICRMTGYLHLIVPTARFRLLRGEQFLNEYTFNTGIARHRFCRICGIKAFYVPRSNPDGIDVNVHCLDASTIDRIEITPFDDNDRDAATAAIAHLSDQEGHDKYAQHREAQGELGQGAEHESDPRADTHGSGLANPAADR